MTTTKSKKNDWKCLSFGERHRCRGASSTSTYFYHKKTTSKNVHRKSHAVGSRCKFQPFFRFIAVVIDMEAGSDEEVPLSEF